MEIRERIAKIIALEGVTAAAFADMVGIQRSNVSHILNGRSGPSLELLQKILSTFPHYNTDWLVMGRGEIRRQPVQKTIFDEIGEPDPYADIIPDSVDNAGNPAADDMAAASESEPQSADSQNDTQKASGSVESQSASPAATPIAATASHQVEVKQVLVLYSDGTFTVYNKQ
ncbi:MAG: helix-turn-helix transcriptional regulator [Salinivirgaceae bacterium]|nr:helix-turn-helix transcriptional regulator [Salinivirgaceae bacterium]MBR6081786.1 helix-turn-helix transcriptional regulator [Salinivirgaceae bacterium]